MSADLEEQIAQLENSLGQEQQRLEKLWDAYEQQEKDFNASLDRINYLESDIETRQTMIASLQELLTERDTKLRDIEIQRQRQSKIAAEYEPKIKEMQGIIEDQTEKYERLFVLYIYFSQHIYKMITISPCTQHLTPFSVNKII